MSKGIVDGLEAVHVQEENGNGIRPGCRTGEVFV